MISDSSFIKKVCERCNNEFSCNANNIKNCFCYVVSLPESARKEISEKYSNCLCEKCLLIYEYDKTNYSI